MKVIHKTKKSYKTKVCKRYSESFKLHVLEELSTSGITKQELSRKYKLGGETISKWIEKYNRTDLMNRKVIINMPKEKDQSKELKQRIAELEKALAQTQLDKLCNDALLEVAAEQLGYEDRHELKKRLEQKRQSKQ